MPGAAEDGSCEKIQVLGIGQGRTDDRAIAVDPHQIAEIGYPDQSLFQHRAAFLCHRADGGDVGYGAGDLFGGGEQITLVPGKCLGGLHHPVTNAGTIRVGALDPLENTHHRDRPKRDRNEDEQSCS